MGLSTAIYGFNFGKEIKLIKDIQIDAFVISPFSINNRTTSLFPSSAVQLIAVYNVNISPSNNNDIIVL